MFLFFMAIGSFIAWGFTLAASVLTGADPVVRQIWQLIGLVGSGGAGALAPHFTGALAAISAVAVNILVICVLLEFIQIGQRVDTMTTESVVKLMSKIVICKVAIDLGPTLLKWIFEIGATLIKEMFMSSGPVSIGFVELPFVASVSEAWALLEEAYHSAGFIDKWEMGLPVVIIGLVLAFCGLSLAIASYARVFEVFVYVFISPIAIAFLPIGNGDGTGFSPITMNFLKSYAAVCLSGVLIMACLSIFNVITGATIFTSVTSGLPGADATLTVNDIDIDFGKMIALMIYAVALSAAVKKCPEWSKTILGVGA